MVTIDVVINIGSYKGPLTEVLIANQLKILKKDNYNNINVIYILAIKNEKSRRYRRLINYINTIANSLDMNINIVLNTRDKGLAHGRNIGILLSKADVIAYIDDDAIPSINWATRLARLFEQDSELAGVFGKIEPLFIDDIAICSRVPKELYWLFSCTPSYMPQNVRLFYRGFGANMAFRRDILYKLGGFRIGLGVGSSKKKWVGGEETELALRLCNKGYKVLYDPDLIVYHVIPQFRCTLSYALRRAYDVGKINGSIMYMYRKYIRSKCREYLTQSMLKKIMYLLIKGIVADISKLNRADKVSRVLFRIAVSLSFFLGMINIDKSLIKDD